jgi:hypothetical protein
MREEETSKQVGCAARTHREAERCVIASSTYPTGCGAGERERSEPALQECRAPQKAPNEASRVRRKDASVRWAVRHRKLDAPYKLLKTPQKAPNEANPESAQSLLPLAVKSSATEPAGRERSRSAAGGAVPHDAGNDPFDPIAPAGEGNGRARGRECRSLV